MTARAAEMARIMMEEWSDDESAESFALRRFAKDRLSDLGHALKIMEELETADEAAGDHLFPHPPRKGD